MANNQKHLYHLVDPSPWPIATATSALSLLVGSVLYMHSIEDGLFVLIFSFLTVLACASIWWRDIIREATFEGRHTSVVQQGLRYGMFLFIISEVCFFVAFFWAFFHSSLAPNVEIGSVWPPEGITPFDAWGVPGLNTLILLTSGATITWAHHSIIAGSRTEALMGIEATLYLALFFTFQQVVEYTTAPFSINDGIFGSTFFMATGFHGFHVVIGTIFIGVMMVRVAKYHFTKEHHFGFEASAWYWHFVDVVWLFLFATIYWWGGATI